MINYNILPSYDLTLCEDISLVPEVIGNKKYWYIKGIFMQANVINRNKRIYPKEILDRAVDDYINEYVNERRAVGELSHPNSSKVNPDRFTHLITELKIDGNNYIGKAKILDTYWGKQVQALLEGGVKMGVSSRCDGTTLERSDGISIVNPGLVIRAIDIVYDPSAPDAFVESLMESTNNDWDLSDPDVVLANQIRESIKKSTSKTLNESYLRAWNIFLSKCISQ